jgi:hypothetical protein
MKKRAKPKRDSVSASGDSLVSTEGSGKTRGVGRGRHPNSRKGNANLKPFPKGVAGNPGGLPGTDVAARIARRIFEGNEAAIYEGMGRALLEGRAYDFSVLADRAYGKIKDKHELSSPDGEAIRLLVKVVKPSLKDPG